MKILHTADWHAGRSLHGKDRTSEIAEALQELAEYAKTQAVDLILVAGDVFDSKNPSADAEQAVYDFFLETGRANIPSVVIAGNHDSPSRLDAVRQMLKLAQVHAFGHPKVAGEGGAFDLDVNGEAARIAVLPFISERRIVKVAELLESDAGQWREKYQQGMRRLIQNLSEGFSPDTVNLLMLHTAMNGATLSNSEYVFHCTEAYSLSPNIFPETANYVALGHIHKPQSIDSFPDNAGRYSGSIIQLDFGEQGDKKFAYLVEAEAGKPTELLEEYAIQSGKRLRRVKLTPDELDAKTPELAEFEGWLKVTVELERPLAGLKDRIKSHLPNVLVVEQQLPEQELERQQGVDLEQVSKIDAFARYYEDQRGTTLPDAIRDAFVELYEEQTELEVGA